MIEITIRDYLSSILNVPVLLEKPKEVHTEYVLMELLDQGEINKIGAVTFDFTSQANTLYNAKVLSERVRHALESIVELDNISSAKFGGARYRISNKTYKHIITFNFYYYREEII